MNWLIDNWYMIFIISAIFFVCGYEASKWIKKPNSQKIENVKSWLVWACIEAEKHLGGGTGQVKLREVYDAFVTKFPAIADIVSFETFGNWVKDALAQAEHLMNTNNAIREYVGR